METAITVKSNVTVKSNDFEKLLEKINAEREIEKHSELNVQKRLEILKSIASVYFFMRCALGMPYRAISLEEFEIAQSRLKLIAEEKIKKFWPRFWHSLGKETFWYYYIKFGYFDGCVKSIFGGMWGGYNYYYLIERFYEICKDKFSKTVTPNAEALMVEIFVKKYGAAKEKS